MLLVLPVVLPMLTGVLCVLVWGRRLLQRIISTLGAVVTLAASLAILTSAADGRILATQISGWPAPYGITLVADLFSALMLMISAVMGMAAAIYSLSSMDEAREHFGYYPLLHILLMGVNGAFLTGDIFNMFVWYEVMLMASFVLMALGGERAQLEGALKYVTMNLIASMLFLAAVGILYGITGALNMADLALRVNGYALDDPRHGLMNAVSILFLIAFGLKAAIFPLFSWLPASYHTPPIAVTIILSALLTKVGVYSLIRVFTLIFVTDADFTHTLILVLAGFTMVTGVLGAVAQMEVRRLLSFHIVSQIGYLLMGLGVFTAPALAAAIFFMLHVILAKSALFMVSGAAQRLLGTYDLKYSGGLYQSAPLLAALFLIPALALAGMPPFSGFFAKLALVQAGLDAGQFTIVGVSLAVSILTLFSMTKIWAEAYWKRKPDDKEPDSSAARGAGWLQLVIPTAVIGGLTLVLGVAAEPFFVLSLRAAEQLVDSRAYIEAVLGATAVVR